MLEGCKDSALTCILRLRVCKCEYLSTSMSVSDVHNWRHAYSHSWYMHVYVCVYIYIYISQNSNECVSQLVGVRPSGPVACEYLTPCLQTTTQGVSHSHEATNRSTQNHVGYLPFKERIVHCGKVLIGGLHATTHVSERLQSVHVITWMKQMSKTDPKRSKLFIKVESWTRKCTETIPSPQKRTAYSGVCLGHVSVQWISNCHLLHLCAALASFDLNCQAIISTGS